MSGWTVSRMWAATVPSATRARWISGARTPLPIPSASAT